MIDSERVQMALELIVVVRSDYEVIENAYHAEKSPGGGERLQWSGVIFARMEDNLDKLHAFLLDLLTASIKQQQENSIDAEAERGQLPF